MLTSTFPPLTFTSLSFTPCSHSPCTRVYCSLGFTHPLLPSPGFSFQPPVRAPFDKVLDALAATKVPIVSVDIPSGWGVEAGRQPLFTSPDKDGNHRPVETIDPDVLVSLTVPKEGVREFKGRHWLGGRFVPEWVLLHT